MFVFVVGQFGVNRCEATNVTVFLIFFAELHQRRL